MKGLNVLFFKGFHPQNIFILFLFFMNIYLLRDKEFDTTYEEYEIIYPDGAPGYISKDDFDSVQVILF